MITLDPTTVASAAPAPAPLRLAGYAALFNVRDGGGDTILPGAFARTLAVHAAAGDRLPLYWQHRPDQRIGWIDSAAEDGRGLRVTATLDDAQGMAAQAVRQGKVTGLSFGYRVTRGRTDASGRLLDAVDLFEVSLVTRPMQPMARVHLVARAPDAPAIAA